MAGYGGVSFIGIEYGGSALGLIFESSFSMKVNIGLSRRFTGPKLVVICLRFSTSALFMAPVSRMAGKKSNVKVAAPMTRVIQLAKASVD